MTASVALVGIGRTGRKIFRQLYRRPDLRVAAVVDTAKPAALEYLLRFDTQQGRFPDPLSFADGAFVVGGRRIPLVGRPAEEVSWRDLGVDVVLEATGRDLGRAALQRHLDAGAKRVVLCAPPSDALDYVHVPGVTEARLAASHRLVSNASATSHALGAVLRVLEEAFGLERAMFTVIHALSKKQRLADVPADDLRSGRAAGENIVPQESRSAAVLQEVLPGFTGKLTGSAMNVPVTNGSAIDLVVWHDRPVTPATINDAVRRAVEGPLKGVVTWTDDPIVSADVGVSDTSATFDSLYTMTMGERLSKTLLWFDAGAAYARTAVDLAARLAAFESGRTA